MTPEEKARLAEIELELEAHNRTGSICLHMQACCSIGTGEHADTLVALVKALDAKLMSLYERTDLALANEATLHHAALDRAEQAEIERNQTRGLLTVETALREAAEERTRLLTEKLREVTALGEQLDAAVCVLRALDVKLAEPFTDLDGTEIGAAIIAEKSDVESHENPDAISAFAKIAHLVKP